MDDTDKPDPVLMKVPLIRNPKYQPPKAITLNQNYGKLIPTLSKTVLPPKFNLTDNELKEWTEEIERLKNDKFNNENDIEEIKKFESWVSQKLTKVAPGFDSSGGVMTPMKVVKRVDECSGKEDEEINELDKVFGKATI